MTGNFTDDQKPGFLKIITVAQDEKRLADWRPLCSCGVMIHVVGVVYSLSIQHYKETRDVVV